jgi:hypothetical protein
VIEVSARRIFRETKPAIELLKKEDYEVDH